MAPAQINQKELREAVRALESLADTKSPIIYRTAVELESKKGKINLRASDSESEAEVLVSKSGGKAFSLLVQTRILRRALDAFDDDNIFIEQKDSELILKNGKSRSLALATIDNSRLPERIAPGEKLAEGLVNAAELSVALQRAIKIAQGSDGARPIINSVVFKKLSFLGGDYLNIVSTDGKRMIEAPVKINNLNGNIFKSEFVWPILSVKALAAELQKTSKDAPEQTATITDFENVCQVDFNSRSWRSAGLNGNYPDTDSIFQKARGDNLLYFDRKGMARSLKALASISVGDAPAVLKLSGGLSIEYKVPGMARFQEEIEESVYHGESQEIAFNHQYLAELCQLISGDLFSDDLKSPDQIKARIPSDANAVLFYGDNFVRVLLMPIRH